MSFAAIQQQQLDRGAAKPPAKKTLLEIQKEESDLQKEIDFLSWWTAEEERMKAEAEAEARALSGSSNSVGPSGRAGNSSHPATAQGKKRSAANRRKPQGQGTESHQEQQGESTRPNAQPNRRTNARSAPSIPSGPDPSTNPGPESNSATNANPIPNSKPQPKRKPSRPNPSSHS